MKRSGVSAVIALAAVAAFFPSCQNAGRMRVISPGQVLEDVEWTEKEKSEPTALRTLKTVDGASYHLVRLNTKEPPHVHETHDGVVFLLTGHARVRLAGKTVEMRPGDVLNIPRGVVHWGENLHPAGSVVYVVFTPAFDGKDYKVVPDAI